MGQGILLSADQEVDFMVHGVFSYKWFGHTVWISTTHVCVLFVFLILGIFALCAIRAMKHASDVPTGFQNVVEIIVEMLDNMVKGTMGKSASKFANYIGTIFIFIFFSNISGLLGLRPPTADYGTTLALALITFVLIQYSAFKTSKLHVFTDLFKPIPILFPNNLIGEFATPLSMSLRLFGNIMAGTIMMALWYGLLPWLAQLGIPAFLHMYFDLFSGAIQTFVFAMLTMTFITDKREA